MTVAERSGLRKRRRRLVVVAVVVLITDLVTKVSASVFLAEQDFDLPGPLDLRLSHNPGVAFGLGNRAPAWLILGLTAMVAVAIALGAWRGAFVSGLAAGLVVGGAVANLIDRTQAGTVVDFLYLGWWPTFNVADAAIVVGGAGLVVAGWRAQTKVQAID